MGDFTQCRHWHGMQRTLLAWGVWAQPGQLPLGACLHTLLPGQGPLLCGRPRCTCQKESGLPAVQQLALQVLRVPTSAA